MSALKITLVQHSGFGYAGKTEFIYGLETRTVPSRSLEKLKRAGALLFDSYNAAEEAAQQYMYPDTVTGFRPRADLSGQFHPSIKVDQLALFVPVASAA